MECFIKCEHECGSHDPAAGKVSIIIILLDESIVNGHGLSEFCNI